MTRLSAWFVVLALAVACFAPTPVAHAVDGHDEGAPSLMAGPMWGIRYPYQIVGIGAFANYRFETFLNVYAAYQYGLSLDDVNDSLGNHWAEVYVGVPFLNWKSTVGANVVLAQHQIGDLQITQYVPAVLPSHEALIGEVGIITGNQTVGVARTNSMTMMDETTDEEHQMLNFAVGARYMYTFNASFSDFETVRNHTAITGHLLFGPAGNPDGSKQSGTPIGFKLGASMLMWANSFGTLELELGLLPGGGGWYFGLGNNIPIWIF